MKEADQRREEIERRLQKARLEGPSAELRTRTVSAMRETWKKAPADIPWRIPLRRLGLAAAAAVLLVSCTNSYSVWSVARWQAGPRVAVKMIATDFEEAPEVPYGPFVQHLLAVRRSSARNSAILLQYAERWRDSAEGAELPEGTEEPDTVERRSRLVPVASDIGWHA
jgi:hypothetical protein